MSRVIFLLAPLALASCTADEVVDESEVDLPLGDVSAEDMKADGDWGAALTCKDVPELPPLVSPQITLSIDGLTLHLTDPATGFDKVYPVGAGVVDQNPESGEFRESLSYYPVSSTGRSDFAITPASIQPCKTWWTDPATGEKTPVFAGLPFMSFHGNYAIHGPIDGYRAANGGSLRRGYVSHGCFRMQGADVLEVYARIKGVAKVPVRVQRSPERRADGTRVDLAQTWIGAECRADADCNFSKGFCAKNAIGGRGFCSARCTSTCADRAGNPGTFCVADPSAPNLGMCVPKAQATNFDCRPYDHLGVAPATPRFNQPAVVADVCVPKSPGWVGDHCFASSDCANGTTCRGASALTPGLCTMSCDRFCDDLPGTADTFCARVPALSTTGGSCVRQCTPGANAPECPSNTTCTVLARNSGTGSRAVCVPKAP
ncbi:MAG: L,D-transpeptidase [Deltaproteobacteria bacterium]|nr:L,D-transpeptidase [Deltaproteobacteria bacterium]